MCKNSSNVLLIKQIKGTLIPAGCLMESSKDDLSQLSLVKMTHPEYVFIILMIDNINITNDNIR